MVQRIESSQNGWNELDADIVSDQLQDSLSQTSSVSVNSPFPKQWLFDPVTAGGTRSAWLREVVSLEVEQCAGHCCAAAALICNRQCTANNWLSTINTLFVNLRRELFWNWQRKETDSSVLKRVQKIWVYDFKFAATV